MVSLDTEKLCLLSHILVGPFDLTVSCDFYTSDNKEVAANLTLVKLKPNVRLKTVNIRHVSKCIKFLVIVTHS